MNTLEEAGSLEKFWRKEVIGLGGFGTALVHALQQNCAGKAFNVVGVSREEATACPERKEADAIILAIPSTQKENIKKYIKLNPHANIILTAKGPAALAIYEELSEEEKNRVFVLSGPNKADQLVNGEPSAAVLAGKNRKALGGLHEGLNSPNFRLYKSESPNVIQLSGVLKNLIVLELGKVWGSLNSPEQKTKLLMQALRAAYSVIKNESPDQENAEEFWGIAGLGDILLCLEFFKDSEGSRNFQYGVGLGCAVEPQALKDDLGTVEGAPTSEGWHDESLDWLKTSEMNALKNAINQGVSTEEITEREDAEHTKMFIRAFTVLEEACEQMGLNENTRAWAFCRLHKELQELFPKDSKNEILHAMCEVVLSNTRSTEFDSFILPQDLGRKKVPMLAGLEALTHDRVSVDELKEGLLERDTPSEGFNKTA